MESLEAFNAQLATQTPVSVTSVRKQKRPVARPNAEASTSTSDQASQPAESAPASTSARAINGNGTSRKSNGKASSARSVAPAMPVIGEQATFKQKQNEMLATKWLQSPDLKKLAETEGLEYKTGVFTSLEVEEMHRAIENYKKTHSLSDYDLVKIINTKGVGQRGNHKDLFSSVAMALPGRPLFRVYQRMVRDYHPQRGKGPWTADEDEALERSFAEHGSNWEKASVATERPASDCKDRYRNHIAFKNADLGKWNHEEEEQLFSIIEAVADAQGTDYLSPQSEIFWSAVAKRMETRSPQQCRHKWVNFLLPKMLTEDPSARARRRPPLFKWDEDRVLLEKVKAMPVREPAEIPFAKLLTPEWTPCGPMQLRTRFRNMWECLSEDEQRLPWSAAIDKLFKIMEIRNQPRPKKKGSTNHSRKIQKGPPAPPKSSEMVEEDSEDEAERTATQGTVIPETQLEEASSAEPEASSSRPAAASSQPKSKKRRHGDETAEERSARKAAKKARRQPQNATEPAPQVEESQRAADPSNSAPDKDARPQRKADKKARKLSQGGNGASARREANGETPEERAARKAAKAAKKARRASQQA